LDEKGKVSGVTLLDLRVGAEGVGRDGVECVG
jgi:hypothetical protein